MPTWWTTNRGEESARLGPLLSEEQWLAFLEESELKLDLLQGDEPEVKGNIMLVLTSARNTVVKQSIKPASAITGKEESIESSEAPANLGSGPGDTAPKTEPTPTPPGPSPIVLLHRHSLTTAIEVIGARLASCCSGREILHMSLSSISESPLQEGSFFVSLMELDEPLLTDITEAEFTNLKQVLATKDSYLLWVTSGVHLLADKPEMGLVTGFARALRNELLSFRFNILDISAQDTETRAQWVSNLFTMLSSRPADMGDLEALDWEFCEYGGIIYVPRLITDQKTRARYGNQSDQHQTGMEPYRQEEKNLGLVISSRGMLSSLVWKDHELGELEPDHVEVRVVANGLNFKVRRFPTGCFQKKRGSTS